MLALPDLLVVSRRLICVFRLPLRQRGAKAGTLPSSADTPCRCAGSLSVPGAWTGPPGTAGSRRRTWTRTPLAAAGTPPGRTQTLSRCSAAAGTTQKRDDVSASASRSTCHHVGERVRRVTSVSTATVTSFFRLSQDRSEIRSAPRR